MKALLSNMVGQLFGRSSKPMISETQTASSMNIELSAASISFEEWLHGLSGRIYGDISAEAVQHLGRMSSSNVERTRSTAQDILSHQFNLLGSGHYFPHDPDRTVRINGYSPLDWYLDPVSGLRFPRGIPYKEWKLYEMRPGNADVKLPWELGRCQHFVILGQAFRMTNDPRFAQEIADEVTDFIEANPVGIGINWTCTMDVAIRALNWVIGLMLTREANLSSEFYEQAYGALFDHGIFIYANLENNYEVTSNHFLSNVVGLYYLSALFCDLPTGAEWNKFCRASLEEEIHKQVLDDGADYESSVPYHRLVTELFLGAARLGDWRREPLSATYLERLRKMVQFLIGVMRPDGLMPQIGDADDGRLHIFTGYGRWNPQDARHLLGPAAMLLNEPEWLRYLDDDGVWETAWWGYDASQIMPSGERLAAHATLFPQAGLAVIRDDKDYLLVTNGIVGTKGFGNHKHNDQLAFEFHSEGIPLLVDPGSYVYTSDCDARNLFRSTGYHNTLKVDNEEQNEMRPEWIFRLFETARAEHIHFKVEDSYVEYCGKHVGYQRLAKPVTHERTLRLLRRKSTLAILDRLEGSGKHMLHWHFHFAPGVEVVRLDETAFRLSCEGNVSRLVVPARLEGQISDAWYSPSYGVKVPCRAIDLACQGDIRGESMWLFMVAPERYFSDSDLSIDLIKLQDEMAQRKEVTVS